MRLILILALCTLPAFADDLERQLFPDNVAPQYSPYVYHAEVIKVVDADTIDCVIDLGFNVSTTQRLRLYGINAWETRGAERERGLLAKAWLIAQLEGQQLLIETQKDKQGKYGRYLATLYVNDVNLNVAMVHAGHARFHDYD